jgi:transposase
MSMVPHHVESTGSDSGLYMALELGAQRWLLAFGGRLGGRVRRHTIPAGDRVALQRAIGEATRRLGIAEGAPVRSCYEAGREGFWIHRWLATVGVTNVVVDSSSIEVNRRSRRRKTDRLDAEKLLQMLIRYWAGDRRAWTVVHVPTVETEDARHAERTIATLTAERTRQRNRVHSLLALHGVRVRITARLGAQLATLIDWAGQPLPAGLVARLAVTWRQLVGVEAELRTARRAQQAAVRAGATAAAVRAARLQQLRGIQAGSAMVLAKELLARDLRNRRQVGALTGFVAVPSQSGEAAHDQGISRAGLRALRSRLVELAWVWVQYQPASALTQWYQRRFAGGGPRLRRIGIVALARKLVIALWRFSEQNIVPAGAVLRP